ncbi:MAG: hypothetical protein WBQ37_18180 [Candidatus Competibacter sp.]
MPLIETMTVLDKAPAWREDEEEKAGFGALNTARGGLPLQRLTVNQRFPVSFAHLTDL